jgi:hypothetical protein
MGQVGQESNLHPAVVESFQPCLFVSMIVNETA